MFERQAEDQATYIGKFPAREDDILLALGWAEERARTLGSFSITVIAPTRDHFKDNGFLSRLPATVERETPRTLDSRLGRTRAVVVSCWPTARSLEQLDKLPGLKALVVVPWLEEDIDTWRRARSAVDLLGRHAVPPAPTISDPVVKVALQHLTTSVNLSTGLHHPDDRSAAIQTFKVLKRNNHRIDPAEIRIWAMANGWAAEDARVLSEYAQGVISGHAYRTVGHQWNTQVINVWRQEAAGIRSTPESVSSS